MKIKLFQFVLSFSFFEKCKFTYDFLLISFMSLEIIQIENSQPDKQQIIDTNKKNNKSSKTITQQIRQYQINTCLKSIQKIGTCLNDKNSTSINSKHLDKVCFMLINSYENNNQDLGQGPLNNGLFIGLNHHRFGYKVFYLYNPRCEEFVKFLGFFLQNTTQSLTIFYSGPDSSKAKIHDIEFKNGPLSSKVVGEIISHNINESAKVIFITDSCNGGSVFDINSLCSFFCRKNTKVISFYVTKGENKLNSKEYKKSHGIFINYFCRIMCDSPEITPNLLVKQINPSIHRFDEFFKFETTSRDLSNSSIFSK